MPSPIATRARAICIILIAAWFGMAAGLAEGGSYLLLQTVGWVSWETRLIAVDPNILWASPFVDVSLFLLIGLMLLPFLSLIQRADVIALATGLFATAAYYAFLGTSGRIQGFGILMLSLGLGVVTARWMHRNVDYGLALLRRTFIPLLGLTIVVGIGAFVGMMLWSKLQIAYLPPAPPKTPNVLLIVLDDLRADHVGAYGYDRPTTPFLDEYARHGVLFDKAFANSSWSLTSHASLFTGRLPNQHGATLFPYDGRYPTLAQFLASRGYATAGFASNTYFLTKAQGLTRGFQHWENIFTGLVDTVRRTLFGRKFETLVLPHIGLRIQPGRLSAAEINARMFRWLDHRPNRPFFVFLNYMEAHAPYSPSPADLSRFTANPSQIIPPERLSFHWRAQSEDLPTNPEVRSIAYDASVAYLDEQLSQLIEGLQRRGLDKDLLVIITSDHGELLGEHGMIGHGTSLYMQQIHVPLLIVFPGKVPKGERISAPVGLHNIPGTVAELAGLNSTIWTSSLTGCWSGAACGSGTVISELVGGDFPGIEPTAPNRRGWIKSVINSHQHLLLQQDGTVSLFDWLQDPRELHNLVDLPEEKHVTADLGATLTDAVAEAVPVWSPHAPR